MAEPKVCLSFLVSSVPRKFCSNIATMGSKISTNLEKNRHPKQSIKLRKAELVTWLAPGPGGAF